MSKPEPQFVIRWLCNNCAVEHTAQGSYAQCEAVQKRLLQEDGVKLIVIYASAHWIETRMDELEANTMPFAFVLGIGQWDPHTKRGGVKHETEAL